MVVNRQSVEKEKKNLSNFYFLRNKNYKFDIATVKKIEKQIIIMSFM
jgi:hypothetical protein